MRQKLCIGEFGEELTVTLLVRAISSLGYAMIAPYIAVLLITYKNFDVASAAFLTGLFGFSQTGLMIMATFIINRFGIKKSMTVGRILGGGTYFLYIFIDNTIPMAVLIISMGLGTSLYNLSCKSCIAFYTTDNPQKRIEAFSFFNMAFNLGGTIGPLLGGIFIDSEWMTTMLLLISGLNILSAFIIDRIFGEVCIISQVGNINFKSTFNKMLRVFFSQTFIIYFIVSLLTQLSYNQFLTSVSFHFANTNISMYVYSIMLTMNAAIVTMLQVPLLNLFNKIIKDRNLYGLGLGAMLIALGIGGIFLFKNIILLVIFTLLLTLGEIITIPFEDKSISDCATESGETSAYFSIAGLGWSLAKGIGGGLGISLLSMNPNHGGFILASFAIISSISCFVLCDKRRVVSGES